MPHRHALPTLLVCLSCARPADTPRPPAAGTCTGPVVAFVNTGVVDVVAGAVRPARTVITCGDRVAALGAAAHTTAPAGAREVDGTGRFLLPGLADMHAHLVRPADLFLYVARGVTTVRNMWGAPVHLEWRNAIQRGGLPGPRVVTAGPLVDGEHPVHDGSLVVRGPDDADRAVRLHRERGYDFVKVYSGLSAPAYQAAVAAAHAAGLPVAGHVPRAVGLEGVLRAGQRSVEHLDDNTVEALQRDDSPVKRLWDRASRRRKADFVDGARLARLGTRLRDHGAWLVPTRTVLDEAAPLDEVRARLTRADAAYVPAADRAIWELSALPRSDEAAEVNRKWLALADGLMVALRVARAPLLVGTDTGNPLVVPGYSVHDELRHWVRLGFTPAEALRAATVEAAGFLGAHAGEVAVGHRADLVLLDADPLADIGDTTRISGVMAAGRWYDAAALDALLARARAALDQTPAPPADDGMARVDRRATFTVTWRNTPFGGEHVVVGADAAGRRVVRVRSHDPHKGQVVSGELVEGGGAALESDGPAGRGRLVVGRADSRATLRGTTLPGLDAATDVELPPAAVLGIDHSIAAVFLLAPRVAALAPGDTLAVEVAEVALGSAAQLRRTTWTFTRGTGGQVQLGSAQAPPGTLVLDADGWPLSWDIPAFGDVVRYQRVAVTPGTPGQ